ncbi:MAG: hypothetical protein JNL67_11350 [Planctomycetaceae bacterium]|nr:hypothetical protein [Planctomycetaceae bacterium]
MKLTLLLALQLLACLFSISAVTYGDVVADLKGDWSDTSNPNVTANGTWTYRQGTSALPLVNDWTWLGGSLPQPAWAPSNSAGNFLPAIFRSTTVNFDWQIGDIIIHSNDASNGNASAYANVTWTSSLNAVVNIDGNAWMGRDAGRGNNWTLLLNGSQLSSGHVESGDPYSRSNPFSFQNGSGGSAALSNVSIVAGDVIELRVEKTTTLGDFVGVNLSISSVPEPSGFLILTIATVGGSLCTRQRKRTPNPKSTKR